MFFFSICSLKKGNLRMAHKRAQMVDNAIRMHQDDTFLFTGLFCRVRSKDSHQAGHQNIYFWVGQQG